ALTTCCDPLPGLGKGVPDLADTDRKRTMPMTPQPDANGVLRREWSAGHESDVRDVARLLAHPVLSREVLGRGVCSPNHKPKLAAPRSIDKADLLLTLGADDNNSQTIGPRDRVDDRTRALQRVGPLAHPDLSRLDPVARRKPPMGVAGALIGGARAAPREHLPGPPPSEAHEVALGAALREPRVGERVPKLMRMDRPETGFDTATPEHLRDT